MEEYRKQTVAPGDHATVIMNASCDDMCVFMKADEQGLFLTGIFINSEIMFPGNMMIEIPRKRSNDLPLPGVKSGDDVRVRVINKTQKHVGVEMTLAPVQRFDDERSEEDGWDA